MTQVFEVFGGVRAIEEPKAEEDGPASISSQVTIAEEEGDLILQKRLEDLRSGVIADLIPSGHPGYLGPPPGSRRDWPDLSPFRMKARAATERREASSSSGNWLCCLQ